LEVGKQSAQYKRVRAVVIELEDFEREGAIASLKAGQQVIPVSLDAIR
jgi:hypothetical protein